MYIDISYPIDFKIDHATWSSPCHNDLFGAVKYTFSHDYYILYIFDYLLYHYKYKEARLNNLKRDNKLHHTVYFELIDNITGKYYNFDCFDMAFYHTGNTYFPTKHCIDSYRLVKIMRGQIHEDDKEKREDIFQFINLIKGYRFDLGLVQKAFTRINGV